MLRPVLPAQELVTFKATGAEGSPIYHTNVMMAIGSTCAVVCSESVADDAERQHLLARLHQTHQVCAGRALLVQTAKPVAAICVLALSLAWLVPCLESAADDTEAGRSPAPDASGVLRCCLPWAAHTP